MNYGVLKKNMGTAYKEMTSRYQHPRFAKKLADAALQRDTTYARMALIAKALKEVGALATLSNAIEEKDIVSPAVYFGRSVILTPSFLIGRVYLLNGGDTVVVTEGPNPGSDLFDRNLACYGLVSQDPPFERHFKIAPRDEDALICNGLTVCSWEAVGLAAIEAMGSILLKQDNAFQSFLGDFPPDRAGQKT